LDTGKFLTNRHAQEERTDFELVELSRQGDQSAFAEIVRRNKSKVAATIHGMIGKGDAAEDIGQEVFIRFYHSLANFRGDAAVSTYLIRIAINLSLNEINRIKRKNLFSFDKILEDGSDIADKKDQVSLIENNELVQRSIQKLDIKYRAVLVLRLIDGYSTEETAKILNIPLGTVLSRLTRAQIKLKKYLQPYI
jgi:RNA polymerase sigma-70 factor, ECF subfamily